MGFFKKWNKRKNDLLEVSQENNIFDDIFDDIFIIYNEEEFYRYVKIYDSKGMTNMSILCYVPKDSGLLERKEIVLEALRICGLDIRYVSDNLKADLEVIKTAFSSNPHSIQFAKGITLEVAMSMCDDIPKLNVVASYFPQIIEELQKNDENRNLLLNMLRQNASLISGLIKYQDDSEFIKVATDSSPMYIRYAGKNISDEIIISELKKYYKCVLENMKEYANNNKDNVLEIWNKYHDNLLFLLEMVNDIKERYPERFNNEEFIFQLFYINPILIQTADLRYIKDPFLVEMHEGYEEETPMDVYSRLSGRK